MGRKVLWNQLGQLKHVTQSQAWIIGGDFNVLLNSEETTEFRGSSIINSDIRDFRECVRTIEVFDHVYMGPLFTWCNNQNDRFIAKKLDRVMVNSCWMNSFPNACVEFKPPDMSDHCPAYVWFDKETPDPPKPFKFFNMWVKHNDFMSTVEESWKRPCAGNPMQVLFAKLKRLKTPLKLLNNSHYSDISARVRTARSALQEAQLNLLARYNIERYTMVEDLKQQLMILEEAERDLYKQKAKINWVCDGDLSTKFFFNWVKVKNKQHTIRGLVRENGVRAESYEDISRELIEFFEQLIGTSDPNVERIPSLTLRALLHATCPESLHNELVKPITDGEIKKAFFAQGNDKSPGVDGYTAKFFKHSWPIINIDIINAIRAFFDGTELHAGFSATAITLIPKVPNPSKAKDFRPIACCSVVYKSITRIIVDRLAPIMNDLITANQSAFIKGRSISDNILMAQELVRCYGRNHISPRCTLKVDIQKAFDSIDWAFILTTLEAMNLPDLFISWIKRCITSPTFSIYVNGGLCGYFPGKRGIRQGDPLSPLLFVIAMNVLSNLLNAAADNKIFQYHPKCLRIKLTHLCFADDLMIFTKGNLESILGVCVVLDEFYRLSGLKLNHSKSDLFICGIHSQKVADIKIATGFKIGSFPVRYLGIPLVTRRLSEKDCKVLIERIEKRVDNWAVQKLSYAGRLLLIQAIIYSMVNFWCRHYFLPKGVLKRIQRICTRYFWKGNKNETSSARVSWMKICTLKSEGGLGLKNMVEWNKACMLYLAKRLLMNDKSVWIEWVNAYILHKENFWHITPNSSSMSWTFRRLLRLREEIAPLLVHIGPSSKDYSVSKIWSISRIDYEKVPWQNLLWYSFHIPKHSIIAWMAILNKLPTKDRLLSWGILVEPTCTLCHAANEDRNHLFMECRFTQDLWLRILTVCNLPRAIGTWNYELHWACTRLRGKTLVVLILKLAWCSLLYNIWKERNLRHFQSLCNSEDHVLGGIMDTIRTRLSRKNINLGDPTNRALCNSWSIVTGDS